MVTHMALPPKTEKQKQHAKALRSVLNLLRKEAAKPRAVPTLAAAAAPMAAGKDVTFACSHPGCVVGITCAGVNFGFVTSGIATFPEGSHTLCYRVQGPANAPLAITSSGAKMPTISDKTDGSGRAAGTRPFVIK